MSRIFNLPHVFTALITPFSIKGEIDYEALKDLINWQIESGITGLLVMGSTGEAATLDDQDKVKILEFAIDLVKNHKEKIWIMAGINYNSTAVAVAQAIIYQKIGVDILLVNNPAYNKPSEDGIFAHFKAINDAVNIPILVYNIPGRAIIDLHNGLMLRLFELNNVIGIKDCTRFIERAYELTKQAKKPVYLFSGEDNAALFYKMNGGYGVISVTSNVMPVEIVNLYAHLEKHEYEAALKIHLKFMDLFAVLFCETNPVPAKYALHFMRKYSDNVRLPLLTLHEKSKNLIEEVLRLLIKS